LDDAGGPDRLLGQRPLQSGEPACATEGRGAVAASAAGQSAKQLGLHGDGVVGLELEGVVGAVAGRDAGSLGRATPPGQADGVADGVQDLRKRFHKFALSDPTQWPAVDLPLVELESLATGVLPRVGTLA